jgi:O-antigen/teichoic acid export membrane protein
MEQPERRFRRTVSETAAIGIAGTGLGFLSQALLARAVGPLAFGVYAIALSYTNVLRTICVWSFDSCALRFVPGYVAVGRHGEIRGLLSLAGASTLVICALVAIGFSSRLFPISSDFSSVGALSLLLVLIVSTALLTLAGTALVALNEVRSGTVLSQVTRPSLAICATLLVLAAGKRTDNSLVALGIAAFSTTVAAAFAIASLATAMKRYNAAPRVFRVWEWASFATVTLVTALALSLISTQLDTAVIGTILTSKLAGAYMVASQVAATTMLLSNAIQPVLFRRQAAAVGTGDADIVRRASAELAVLGGGAALVSSVFACLFSPLLLALFGRSYSGSGSVVVVLILGTALNHALSVGPSAVLANQGRHFALGVLNVIFALMALIASIICTTKFGIVGTASATSAVGFVRACALILAQRGLAPQSFGLADVSLVVTAVSVEAKRLVVELLTSRMRRSH